VLEPTDRNLARYGTFGIDDTYVRSTAVIGGTAYAGTGSVNPRLYVVDLRTGAKEQLTLPAGAPAGFAGWGPGSLPVPDGRLYG
jgi:hypothetical protein